MADEKVETMTKPNTIIVPGRGLDGLLFGSSRDETEQILGKPDRVDQYSMEEGGGDETISWFYEDSRLSVHFDEDNGYKLGCMEIDSSQFTIEGHALVGMKKEQVLTLLAELDFGEYEVDDDQWDETLKTELLKFDDKGMNFWFESGILASIQWSPLWLDDDTEDWPK